MSQCMYIHMYKCIHTIYFMHVNVYIGGRCVCMYVYSDTCTRVCMCICMHMH